MCGVADEPLLVAVAYPTAEVVGGLWWLLRESEHKPQDLIDTSGPLWRKTGARLVTGCIVAGENTRNGDFDWNTGTGGKVAETSTAASKGNTGKGRVR